MLVTTEKVYYLKNPSRAREDSQTSRRDLLQGFRPTFAMPQGRYGLAENPLKLSFEICEPPDQLQESLVPETGVSEGVSYKVSPGPFGPRL